MTSEQHSSKRPAVRVDLRTLLLLTFLLAIGFTIGSVPGNEDENFLWYVTAQLNWHFAMLAAASAAIAMGLTQQAAAIWRQRRLAGAEIAPLWFGLLVACVGRLLLAGVLAACLIAQIFIVRGFASLPEQDDLFFYSDPLTTYLWWFALAISLTGMLDRTGPATRVLWRRVVDLVVFATAVCIFFYMILGLAMIQFLVHLACRGVDATLRHTGNRYPLWTQVEEMQFVVVAAAAAGTVIVACPLIIGALSQTTFTRLRCGMVLIAAILLVGAAAYCSWYYPIAMPAVAPDLANAGFCSNWFQRTGGVVLAAMLVAYGSYRITRAVARRTSSTALEVEASTVGDSLPTMLLLLAGVGVYFFQSVRVQVTSPWSGVGESLAYMLIVPDTYFMVAIAAPSLRLARRRWLDRRSPPIRVVALNPRRFAVALVMLSALVAVAVPTFAAFAFAYWLGPWYR